MNSIYVRICWNSKDWKYPTGEAAKLETQSFAHKNGYGHEEWLFRYEWLLSGFDNNDKNSYRYAYTTPIGKAVDSYAGQTLSVFLWTIADNKRRYIVGCINNVYVPLLEERDWAAEQSELNGWLGVMRSELEEAEANTASLTRDSVNIRFRQQDVEIFDPWIDITDLDIIIARAHRYQIYNCDDNAKKVIRTNKSKQKFDSSDPKRSEHDQSRKAIASTTVDPRHIKIQNRLFKTLESKYGKNVVQYEHDYVDLKISTPECTTFIEIKTDGTARKCIRQAIGQVIEYSYYPNTNRATEMLVVGEHAPTENDRTYLIHLRKTFGMPIYYSQFLWDSGGLSERY